MTSVKKRKKFTPEFKRETVALITDQGYSIAKAAQAVGTTETNVRRWKVDLEAETGGDRLNNDERAELMRLRRENKELRLEKEILKKASAFFAKEMK
jgi:transposase